MSLIKSAAELTPPTSQCTAAVKPLPSTSTSVPPDSEEAEGETEVTVSPGLKRNSIGEDDIANMSSTRILRSTAPTA